MQGIKRENFNCTVDRIVIRSLIADINMANEGKTKLSFALMLHHSTKGIRSRYLSNPGGSIIRQNEEKDVEGKVTNPSP